MVELAKLVALSLIAGAVDLPCAEPSPVRVTVVVVLATSNSRTVDRKLAALAREVQKTNRELTGFRIHGSAQKSIPIGGSHTFQIVEGWQARVTIEKPKGPEGRIGLRVRLPGDAEVKYECVCDKFFPVDTQLKTRNGEHLIVAIMARPCTGK